MDFRSVESLLATMPRSPEVEWILDLELLTPDEARESTVALMGRGFPACLALARAGEGDTIVLRLSPDRGLGDSPVGIVDQEITEGLTIASRPGSFVAGRMAHRNTPTYRPVELERHRDELVEFSRRFGSGAPVERLLSELETLRRIPTPLRHGAIWEVSDPEDSLCAILGAAWTQQGDEIRSWLESAPPALRDHPIFARLSITDALREDVDLTDAVVNLIRSELAFDPSYTARFRKPGLGTWKVEALVLGIRWLQDRGSGRPGSVDESLWRASLRYAEDPHGYDGSLHLRSASAVRSSEPFEAWIRGVNACACHARSRRRPPAEAIEFLATLARQEGWVHPTALFDWWSEPGTG